MFGFSNFGEELNFIFPSFSKTQVDCLGFDRGRFVNEPWSEDLDLGLDEYRNLAV